MNIKSLISQGEGVCLDFKKTITNNEKIAKSLVAFANNKGGKLFIGVADNGNIVGVKSEDEERYMILKSAHHFCKPAIEPVFEEISVDGKLILVVSIHESQSKPHYALDLEQKWWAYIRIEDKSVLASRIILEVLKQNGKGDGVFLSYSDDEKKLLRYLEENERITLKEFSKLLHCSYRKAQKIIVSLILTNIIKSHTNEKEEYFVAVR